MVDNEIIPDKAVPVEENLSNKISMASTANSSIFERTEVLTGNAPPCPGKSLILKIKWLLLFAVSLGSSSLLTGNELFYLCGYL